MIKKSDEREQPFVIIILCSRFSFLVSMPASQNLSLITESVIKSPLVREKLLHKKTTPGHTPGFDKCRHESTESPARRRFAATKVGHS